MNQSAMKKSLAQDFHSLNYTGLSRSFLYLIEGNSRMARWLTLLPHSKKIPSSVVSAYSLCVVLWLPCDCYEIPPLLDFSFI